MKITVPAELNKVFELYYSIKAVAPKREDVNTFNEIMMERLRFIRVFMGRYKDYTTIREPKEIKSVNFHILVNNYEPFGGHAAFEVEYIDNDSCCRREQIEVDWFNEESIKRLREFLLSKRVSAANEMIKNCHIKIDECKKELAQIAVFRREDQPDLFSDDVISRIESESINQAE